LSIPTDDASFDIFTQVAALVGPQRRRSELDLMAGLQVKRLFAAGSSQSAMRLRSYVNAVAPHSKAFDGYLLELDFGREAPFVTPANAPVIGSTSTRGSSVGIAAATHPIRSDVGAPVMILNTETEATSYFQVRQADTGAFRFWETAGETHAPKETMTEVSAVQKRDFGALPLDLAGIPGINDLPFSPLRNAAISHMQRWMTNGVAPPVAPRLQIVGDPPVLHRDANGNALGGIRLPQLQVPVASYSGEASGSGFARLIGRSTPFDATKLRALYADHRTYVAQFTVAAQEAVRAGFILQPDADRLIAEAQSSHVPT
jgi:hypothetical protein